MKPATRLLLLIIDSDSARAEQVAASLRLNGTAVHMDRFESVGQIEAPCARYDLALISLDHRTTLKAVGIELLRDLSQDCSVLALGQPECDCSLGTVLAHGFADWVDTDDLLHLREVAKRENARLASARHTSLLRNALLDSERRAAQVMQDAREPHAVIIDGAHALTNLSYRKLLGLDCHDDAIATPFLDLVSDDDRDKAKALLRGYARAESSTRQARLSLRRSDKLVLDATLTLSPYVGDGEQGLLLTVRSLAQLPPPSKTTQRQVPLPSKNTANLEHMRTGIDKAMRQNALKIQFLTLSNAEDETDKQVIVELTPRDAKQKLPTGMQLVRLAASAETTQSLDRWLLFSAARESQRLGLDGTRLHIPISARAINDSSILGWLRQLLGQISQSNVTLTLTLHMEDCRKYPKAAIYFAKSAKDMGCGISLSNAFKASDDLNLLKSLEPDHVQLHPALISSFINQDFSAENLRRLSALIRTAGAQPICPLSEHKIDPRTLSALGIYLCVLRSSYEEMRSLQPS